jgi:TldD protein
VIPTYFAERRETAHVLHRRGSGPKVQIGRYQGVGRTTYTERGSWHDYDPETVLPGFPARETESVQELLRPWPEVAETETALTKLADRLLAEASGTEWPWLVVSLRGYEQDVLAGSADEALRPDRRSFFTVNIEAGQGATADGRLELQARRDSAVQDLTDLPRLAFELLGRLGSDLAEAAELPEQALPDGVRPVVLGVGTGAMFFHELCGHPLEADVVASGTSLLASLRGTRIGQDWLTVLDDPVSPEAVFGYRVDDEGTTAEPVPLIREGTVGDLLHSRATARASGAKPNGHGRRMSYLYPAIPRQAHTRVLPGPHEQAEVLGDGEAVLVERFRVRYVYVNGGGFGFTAPTALLLKAGKPVARLRDVEMTGDIVATLGNVVAVGTRPVAWIGGGGCGKLNQGPLTTGFEQPLVRVEGLRSRSGGS